MLILARMQKVEQDLVKKYKYRPLSPDLSARSRKFFGEQLPQELNVNGDKEYKLITFQGTHFATGYNRIVIGDYGAFIEFSKEQIIKPVIQIKKGEEYRVKDKRYSGNVKFIWLTTKDDSNIKIYYQQKIVTYADYKPGMFYVTPYAIKLLKGGE